jgi:hypothetical protein
MSDDPMLDAVIDGLGSKNQQKEAKPLIYTNSLEPQKPRTTSIIPYYAREGCSPREIFDRRKSHVDSPPILAKNFVDLAFVASDIRAKSSAYVAFDRLRREMQWHLEHGERLGLVICAGCRRFFGPGEAALELADGNAVHLDSYRCLIAWGEHWRAAARAAVAQQRK